MKNLFKKFHCFFVAKDVEERIRNRFFGLTLLQYECHHLVKSSNPDLSSLALNNVHFKEIMFPFNFCPQKEY